MNERDMRQGEILRRRLPLATRDALWLFLFRSAVTGGGLGVWGLAPPPPQPVPHSFRRFGRGEALRAVPILQHQDLHRLARKSSARGKQESAPRRFPPPKNHLDA
jgi:hypothetical protein